MISIVICSQHPSLDKELAENIRQTIGTEYEVVHVDNSQNRYNIFEAYNIGVERAKGDCLCFMHEDVLFHTNNWGQVVETYLSQPFVGALGVAGSCVVLDQLDWRFYGFGQVYLIQGTTTIEEDARYYESYPLTEKKRPLTQVATLDGVWICMRKELFEHISFDTEHFHDFHLYDTDICMQVNQLGLGVFMTYDVLLEHQSEGTFSEGYRKSLQAFADKWSGSLPMIRGMYVTQEEIDKALAKASTYFEERLHNDALVIGLRKLFAQRHEGKTVRAYTKEEKILMDDSLFACCRQFIKNKKEVSAAKAWSAVSSYCAKPYATRRFKVFAKFLWYRFLKG